MVSVVGRGFNVIAVVIMQCMLIHTVLPALTAISSLFYHLIFSLHRWRSMKVAALIFCTHTHPCNIDLNINNIVVLWFTFVVILV